MRHLRLLLLGFLLLAMAGCAKKKDAAEAEGANGSDTAESVPFDQAKDFSLVPEGTIALASVRPSAALKSQLGQQVAQTEEIARALEEAKEQGGLDLNNVARVSVAVWPGEGNVFPKMLEGTNSERPGRKSQPVFQEPTSSEVFREPKLDSVDCEPQPGDEFGGQPAEFEPPGGGNENPLMEWIPKLDGAVFIEFHNPVEFSQIQNALKWMPEPEEVTSDGVTFKVASDVPIGGGIAFWQPHPKMLVVTFKDDIKDIVNSKGTCELVTQALSKGADATASVQVSFSPFSKALEKLSEVTKQFMENGETLPQKLKGLSLFLKLNDGADLSLLLDTTDPGTAKTLKDQFDQKVPLFENQVGAASQMVAQESSQAVKAGFQSVGEEVYKSLKTQVDGNAFHLSLRVPGKATDVSMNALRERAKQVHNINRAKNIALACYGYETQYQKLPFPAGHPQLPEEQRGKLSWRVHVLHYLDESALYRQFKLDEPWDSEHNKALIESMPDVFKLSEETKPGHTQFVAPAGMGFIVDGDKSRSIANIQDGTSNTIMVLTVAPDKAEPWTKPGGFELDPAKAAEILGGHPAGFVALFADGHVSVLPSSVQPEMLRALLTIAGNETITEDDIQP